MDFECIAAQNKAQYAPVLHTYVTLSEEGLEKKLSSSSKEEAPLSLPERQSCLLYLNGDELTARSLVNGEVLKQVNVGSMTSHGSPLGHRSMKQQSLRDSKFQTQTHTQDEEARITCLLNMKIVNLQGLLGKITAAQYHNSNSNPNSNHSSIINDLDTDDDVVVIGTNHGYLGLWQPLSSNGCLESIYLGHEIRSIAAVKELPDDSLIKRHNNNNENDKTASVILHFGKRLFHIEAKPSNNDKQEEKEDGSGRHQTKKGKGKKRCRDDRLCETEEERNISKNNTNHELSFFLEDYPFMKVSNFVNSIVKYNFHKKEFLKIRKNVVDDLVYLDYRIDYNQKLVVGATEKEIFLSNLCKGNKYFKRKQLTCNYIFYEPQSKRESLKDYGNRITSISFHPSRDLIAIGNQKGDIYLSANLAHDFKRYQTNLFELLHQEEKNNLIMTGNIKLQNTANSNSNNFHSPSVEKRKSHDSSNHNNHENIENNIKNNISRHRTQYTIYAVDQKVTTTKAMINKSNTCFSLSKLDHWHSHGVNCLSFSSDGNVLLSGGDEAVLLIWNFELNHKHPIARLGAPLKSILPTADGQSWALSQTDNSISSMAVSNFTRTWRIKNLCLQNPDEQDKALTLYKRNLDLQHLQRSQRWSGNFDDLKTLEEEKMLHRFRVVPTSLPGIICCTGNPGKLQLFNAKTRTIETEISLFEYNRVSRFGSERIAHPILNTLSFSSSGKTLVASISRIGELNLTMRHLRFFRQKSMITDSDESILLLGSNNNNKSSRLDGRQTATSKARSNVDRKKSLSPKGLSSLESDFDFELSYFIANPHGEEDVTHVAYHPFQNFVVSSGADGSIKCWQEQQQQQQYSFNFPANSIQWKETKSMTYRKNQQVQSIIFSPDGSVLCIIYGDSLITLWSPFSMTLLKEWSHTSTTTTTTTTTSTTFDHVNNSKGKGKGKENGKEEEEGNQIEKDGTRGKNIITQAFFIGESGAHLLLVLKEGFDVVDISTGAIIAGMANDANIFIERVQAWPTTFFNAAGNSTSGRWMKKGKVVDLVVHIRAIESRQESLLFLNALSLTPLFSYGLGSSSSTSYGSYFQEGKGVDDKNRQDQLEFCFVGGNSNIEGRNQKYRGSFSVGLVLFRNERVVYIHSRETERERNDNELYLCQEQEQEQEQERENKDYPTGSGHESSLKDFDLEQDEEKQIEIGEKIERMGPLAKRQRLVRKALLDQGIENNHNKNKNIYEIAKVGNNNHTSSPLPGSLLTFHQQHPMSLFHSLESSTKSFQGKAVEIFDSSTRRLPRPSDLSQVFISQYVLNNGQNSQNITTTTNTSIKNANKSEGVLSDSTFNRNFDSLSNSISSSSFIAKQSNKILSSSSSPFVRIKKNSSSSSSMLSGSNTKPKTFISGGVKVKINQALLQPPISTISSLTKK